MTFFPGSGWSSFPDPDYVPDHANKYLLNAGFRRKWQWGEFLKGLVVIVTFLGLAFLLFLMGVAGRWNGMQALLALFGFIAAMGLLERIVPDFDLVKLRCSKCEGPLKRVKGKGFSRRSIFHACSRCKRYVDTGKSNDG